MDCLIVEDDPHLGAVLLTLLEDMGHVARCVVSISSALHALTYRKYDLVLMEHTLPDGTSELLSDHVSMSCPNARIIMMTGTPVYLHGEHSVMAPGVDWLMRKPLPMHDLEALVDYAAIDANHCPTQMTALP